MARTAVIAGTASAVSGGVQRRAAENSATQKQAAAAQQQAMADQTAAQAAAQLQAQSAAAPAAAPVDRIAKIRELGELKQAGLLTEDEFEAEKARILNS
ncbi:MAG TPA: SHOCT domain-containing protein [Nocardioidaceae bacterium]|nr:SHOCT domain-containing protein [Nocardioidaceae bacterium]